LAGTVLPPGPQRQDTAAARAAGLIAVAEDLAGEFSLRPLLERILLRCTELLETDAGSICSVDEAAGTYRKEADIGVACQSGRVFPLTEGMTGAVVARRAPVWFARYNEVPGGHVAAEDRVTLRGVIGVPLQWRGRIIGACIVFSRDERREFGPADAELLQLFAQHAAIALANARMHERAEERARSEAAAAERDRLLGELHDTLAQRLVSVQVHLDGAQRELAAGAGGYPGGQDGATGARAGASERATALSEHVGRAAAATREALVEARQTLLGLAAPPAGLDLEAALKSETSWAETIGRLEVRLVTAGTPAEVDGRVARELILLAREALTNIVRHAEATSVRIGLLYEQGAVSLLVQDDGQGFDTSSGWQGQQFGLRMTTERVREIGGTVDVDSLPGWGTRIRARFPYLPAGRERGGPPLRVLVAARRPALRAGLARLLTWTEPGTEIVGEVETSREAARACRELRPDVALVDLGLPADTDGQRHRDGVTGLLLLAAPQLAVLGLCEAGDDDLVAEAMRAGARGCVDLGATGPQLAQAVVAAGRGEAILSDVVLGQLHRGMRADDLTEREREVRELMEQGLPDRLIAQRLMLSVKTVEKHAGAVLRKTGARNRTELAALAGRSRLR
jgi:signal transduction histidine kinase/DNA-binding NarL/FixJ family response regulator